MKNAIRALLACLCLALSGWALADGVPLITPGPALSASDPIFKHDETKMPNFVKYHPIVLNKGAFGANVLVVTIEGKDYRFVGGLNPAGPPLSASAAAAGFKPVSTRTWSGHTGTLGQPDYGTLTIARSTDGGWFGSIQLPPARFFYFTSGRPVLVETDPSKMPINWQLVTPPSPSASGVTK